jgi:hypothetical protein
MQVAIRFFPSSSVKEDATLSFWNSESPSKIVFTVKIEGRRSGRGELKVIPKGLALVTALSRILLSVGVHCASTTT